MILPDYKLRKWIYEGGLNPFNIGCVNPASVDLRVNTKHIIGLSDHVVHNSLKYVILPGTPILLSTIEFVRMPSDYAGVLYLAHYPVTISHGQRVIQLVLYRLESPPEETYHGKYQNQRGPTKAR